MPVTSWQGPVEVTRTARIPVSAFAEQLLSEPEDEPQGSPLPLLCDKRVHLISSCRFFAQEVACECMSTLNSSCKQNDGSICKRLIEQNEGLCNRRCLQGHHHTTLLQLQAMMKTMTGLMLWSRLPGQLHYYACLCPLCVESQKWR